MGYLDLTYLLEELELIVTGILDSERPWSSFSLQCNPDRRSSECNFNPNEVGFVVGSSRQLSVDDTKILEIDWWRPLCNDQSEVYLALARYNIPTPNSRVFESKSSFPSR